MTSAANAKRQTISASEKSLTVALKVLRDQGMAVDKLLIRGGRIELHIAGIETEERSTPDGDLEQW